MDFTCVWTLHKFFSSELDSITNNTDNNDNTNRQLLGMCSCKDLLVASHIKWEGFIVKELSFLKHYSLLITADLWSTLNTAFLVLYLAPTMLFIV
jgi:hypothetical protein